MQHLKTTAETIHTVAVQLAVVRQMTAVRKTSNQTSIMHKLYRLGPRSLLLKKPQGLQKHAGALTSRSWLWANPTVHVTKTTFDALPHDHAWSAVETGVRHTTLHTCSPEQWAERCLMNSLFHCARVITKSFMLMATNAIGGNAAA
jgi:hypothetical protein